MSQYFKLTNRECCHHGFQFHDGLNTDIIPFTPYGDCEPGGIYFTTPNNIWMWLRYNDQTMFYIWNVSLPDDAQVYHQATKSKADKIILSNQKTIFDFFSDNLQITLINLKQSIFILQYLRNPSTELCFDIIKSDPLALRYIQNPSPEICLLAVRHNGSSLCFVQNQTLELCLAAVQQNGLALAYVRHQSPELCLAAVQQNGLALAHVILQTPEICAAAVTQNVSAMTYVKKRTPEIINLWQYAIVCL